MKIKIRQHDASMPQEDDWSQTGDWLGPLCQAVVRHPPLSNH